LRIETTVQGLRALVQLAELDAAAPELLAETYESQRDRIWRRLAGPLRARYQTLRETGRSPVIVAIERGSCSGCHLRLPTMVESQARRSPAVHACTHCGRMLYAPEFLAHGGSRDPEARSRARTTLRGVARAHEALPVGK
jgi:predicted  nucleic acid-binding Zn-ribbon protein